MPSKWILPKWLHESGSNNDGELRQMANVSDVEDFLVLAAGYTPTEAEAMAQKVYNVEVLNRYELRRKDSDNTLRSEEHRVKRCKGPAARRELWKKAIEELAGMSFSNVESEMVLDGGKGCNPINPQNEKHAVFVIGPPASGKSTIAEKLAEHFGAFILDSDYAKVKLPEYNGGARASLVHEESDELIWGDKQFLKREKLPSVRRIILSKGMNVIIPKIGKNPTQIWKLAQYFREAKGYTTSIVLISLGRKEATRRALQRFSDTGRFVPPSYVFDVVGHEPQLTYFRLRLHAPELWRSHAAYDTSVARGQEPTLLCSSEGWPELKFLSGVTT